jgi:hypothetical protein
MCTSTRLTRKDPLLLHASGPGFAVLGQVTRLGSRRVTYEFIDRGVEHPNEVTAHLFSAFHGVQITAVPCLLVEERVSEPGSPLSTLMIRRCELEFLQLSTEQEKMLWDFLNNEYLRKVREITTERRTARKPEVVPEVEHFKARSFFSLMQYCDEAGQPSSVSA